MIGEAGEDVGEPGFGVHARELGGLDQRERVGRWMAGNAPAGCLFHNAVAAHPDNAALRDLLGRHKAEIGERLAARADRPELRVPLLLVHEGLVQSWPLEGDEAVAAATALAKRLTARG